MFERRLSCVRQNKWKKIVSHASVRSSEAESRAISALFLLFPPTEVFGNAKMTTALLDRLTHRWQILETGDSYRSKASCKAQATGNPRVDRNMTADKLCGRA